jgi:hypothetical protein
MIDKSCWTLAEGMFHGLCLGLIGLIFAELALATVLLIVNLERMFF